MNTLVLRSALALIWILAALQLLGMLVRVVAAELGVSAATSIAAQWDTAMFAAILLGFAWGRGRLDPLTKWLR